MGQGNVLAGKVFVGKKPGVLDPEGATISKALANLGYKQVVRVRSGRVFEVEIAAQNPREAEEKLSEMARKLLSNPVIEDFRVELENNSKTNSPSTSLRAADK
jgi:phosphoribosylformylglycinamidine synthase PurS subunit